MKQTFENNTQSVQMEPYEAPCMEVIEMEIEESILKASDGGTTGGETTLKMETETSAFQNW